MSKFKQAIKDYWNATNVKEADEAWARFERARKHMSQEKAEELYQQARREVGRC